MNNLKGSHHENAILVIEFWNVNVGMTETGVGEIVILNAKKENLFPVELSSELKKVA